jgi:L,D-peptidoglycan transpeptidase YkuD (ErfK/YbiS/YcfS/YnhG family)
VVIVHAPSAGTTHATLETFSKVHGVWVKQFAPMAARIGENGFSDHHTEGVPSTPTGVYGFGATMYGNGSDPGVHYGYHHLVTDDWWDENPSSSHYNQFVHGSDPGGGSEALWTIMPQYEFFAFIKYNSPPSGTARGSAVFLHESVGRETLGCIALPRSDLLDVLRWLNPAANPRIVIGTDAQLSHF